MQTTLKLALTDEQFQQLAVDNEHLRLESTAEGKLVIMPPTGGTTGRRNSNLTRQLDTWSSSNNLGVAFDSSTLFVLPS